MRPSWVQIYTYSSKRGIVIGYAFMASRGMRVASKRGTAKLMCQIELALFFAGTRMSQGTEWTGEGKRCWRLVALLRTEKEIRKRKDFKCRTKVTAMVENDSVMTVNHTAQKDNYVDEHSHTGSNVPRPFWWPPNKLKSILLTSKLCREEMCVLVHMKLQVLSDERLLIPQHLSVWMWPIPSFFT